VKTHVDPAGSSRANKPACARGDCVDTETSPAVQNALRAWSSGSNDSALPHSHPDASCGNKPNLLFGIACVRSRPLSAIACCYGVARFCDLAPSPTLSALIFAENARHPSQIETHDDAPSLSPSLRETAALRAGTCCRRNKTPDALARRFKARDRRHQVSMVVERSQVVLHRIFEPTPRPIADRFMRWMRSWEPPLRYMPALGHRQRHRLQSVCEVRGKSLKIVASA
jgi:hypothetical protein